MDNPDTYQVRIALLQDEKNIEIVLDHAERRLGIKPNAAFYRSDTTAPDLSKWGIKLISLEDNYPYNVIGLFHRD